MARWGRIDILVCNAGINPYYGPLAEIGDDAFDKTMGTNVRSTLWLCNMVLPGMAERGGGAALLVSSIAGLRGTDKMGAYGISKAAEIGMTRHLAVEWGPSSIRVNCIAPGVIRTSFARVLYENPEMRDPLVARRHRSVASARSRTWLAPPSICVRGRVQIRHRPGGGYRRRTG